MAGTAVGKSANEISATIPLSAQLSVGLKLFGVEKQNIPGRHRQPDVEGKRQIGRSRGGINRLDRHEICIESADILVCNQGVGGVGHSGIKPMSIYADPLAQC